MTRSLVRKEADMGDAELLGLYLVVLVFGIEPHFRREHAVEVDVGLFVVVLQQNLRTGIEDEILQKMLDDAPADCAGGLRAGGMLTVISLESSQSTCRL